MRWIKTAETKCISELAVPSAIPQTVGGCDFTTTSQHPPQPLHDPPHVVRGKGVLTLGIQSVAAAGQVVYF